MPNVALDDLVAVGDLPAEDRVGADVTSWSAFRGFAVLNIEGPLGGLSSTEREAALTGLLLGIDRGLGAGRVWPALIRDGATSHIVGQHDMRRRAQRSPCKARRASARWP